MFGGQLQRLEMPLDFRRGPADNAAALALYWKLGFRPCRTLPDYYGYGIPAVRMARDVLTPRNGAARSP